MSEASALLRRDSGCVRPTLREVSAFCLAAALVVLAACAGDLPDDLSERTYPRSSIAPDHVVYEFGPGSLQTTDDSPWGGIASVVYPVLWSTADGPLEVEVRGLDLSGIEYTGDMGWPPDGTDTGALFQTVLEGDSRISLRAYSSLDAFESEGLDHREGLRAFQFSGFNDNQGPNGLHQMAPQPHDPDGGDRAYETFDLRLRYEAGVVEAWVRQHASPTWEGGEAESGRACPSAVAVNNAVPGTEDSIWTGECTQVEPDGPPLAVGAWIPADGGPWQPTNSPGPVRVALYLGNWALAEGPYRVAWDNVVVRGALDDGIASSAGTGFFHPFGTGQSEREPTGRWAAFSYVATSGAPGNVRAMFRYRSAGFEVASEETNGVSITPGTPGRVTLWGPARVNGVAGFRYELRGTDVGGDAPDSLDLRVWGPVPSTRPYFAAFGPVDEGGLEIRALPGDD